MYGWCDWDALGQSNITTGASPEPLVLLLASFSVDAAAEFASLVSVCAASSGDGDAIWARTREREMGNGIV